VWRTESFSVYADYTGPKNTSVAHANSFWKLEAQDYVGVREIFSHGKLQSSTSGRTFPFTGYGSPGLGGFPSLEQPALYNEALSKVYDQLRADIDWSVNLAEARQTARWAREYRDYLIPLADRLAKDANRIVRFIRRFHPSQWGRRWLEYQYGVKPLVVDMYKTMRRMQEFATYHLVKVRGTARMSRSGVNGGGFGAYGGRETIHWTLEERMLIESVFRIPQSRLLSLAQYTSVNPASLAWELLPFSFVADWFMNVGGFLRNLESALLYMEGYQGGFTTYTWKMTFIGKRTEAGVVDPFYGFSALSNSTASAAIKGKTRSVGAPWPAFPPLSVKLGAQRLFSAASLLSLHVTKRM
jgi:hypothetical protein